MRIELLIDSLVSGGAQRQMVELAVLLKKAGHDIRLLLYYDLDFFGDELRAADVPVQLIQSKGKLSRILKVRAAIRARKPDAVIAYLSTPSILAELAGLPRRKFAVIVTELTGTTGVKRKGDALRFQFHRLADAVVTNGQTLADFITREASWLQGKVHVIVNCVDLERFCPPEQPERTDRLSIAVLARLQPVKNPLVLLRAVILLRDQHGIQAEVDWYGNRFYKDGRPTALSSLYQELIAGIEAGNLSGLFRVHDPTTNVTPIYQNASLVCLPSLWEGMSNVICEALSCGRPMLASRVCDNALLVHQGKNGYLFDPNDPQELADRLYDFSRLSTEERKTMGAHSRAIAEGLMAPQLFVQRYVDLAASLQKQ